jgi:hypothetical protein
MKIEQLNGVANQIVITDGEKEIFQSYKSVIAKIENGKTFLDRKFWNYSRTTARYRNQFLGEDTKTTEAKIKSGEYELTDLNS